MTTIDGRTVTRRRAAERAITDEQRTSSAVLAGDPGRWLPIVAIDRILPVFRGSST